MRIVVLTACAALALALAGVAAAGGWATAGLAPPPDDVRAGDTWLARVTILQHGRTPLAGVEPTVTIRNESTGQTRTFPARPTNQVGVYEANVEFPTAGTWRYEVHDGFTQYGGAKTHTFGAVPVGPGSDGSLAIWEGLLGAAAVLALAGIAIALLRPRRARPAAALR